MVGNQPSQLDVDEDLLDVSMEHILMRDGTFESDVPVQVLLLTLTNRPQQSPLHCLNHWALTCIIMPGDLGALQLSLLRRLTGESFDRYYVWCEPVTI